jgi:hypothetical protein
VKQQTKTPALNCVNGRRIWWCYFRVMARQNFAATALYFERRAAKSFTIGLRQQLKSAAAHYRSLAEVYGHRVESENAVDLLIVAVPPRRRRLIELFQAGADVAPQIPVARKGRDGERHDQGAVEDVRAGLGTAS